MEQITITRPDDWHIHLRDGEALKTTVPHAAKQFGRAIVMPNLRPPITTTAQAQNYLKAIQAATPADANFTPLMTLYLTDATSPEEIRTAKESGHVYGVKLYPAGATTNSDSGVTDLANVYETLEAMEEVGLPLLVHGEVTDNHIDIFDREKKFIDTKLTPLTERFPNLKIVFEHITTKEAVQFILQGHKNIGATITAHHLLMNRNDMLVGGIRPHHFCLPVLKRDEHRQELLKVATSGNPKFFLGTDSAPHPRSAKESSCGCAGMYTAFGAIELYAEAFEEAGALSQLDAFAGRNGPKFYGLPENQETITLIRKEWIVPECYEFGDETVIPLRAGQKLMWQIAHSV